ncbi:MAG TPA: pantetheine-phosphate adenylyltransferase [Bacteroidota bacterium]|jgi:pantetheine-phosphate adenylyltransferase|nr:pantetheine-phosphate adenylyltransferase [Bacteroidota bacterium]
MKIAIYPGTFDPITNGHIDVLERALEIFDTVIVAIAVNSSKIPLFTKEERLDILKNVLKDYPKVIVDSFDTLLMDYAKQKNATAIIRGLRAVSDFEYEFQMALMNRNIYPSASTVFLMPHEKYSFLNSTLIREISRLGGDISQFVPEYVKLKLEEKFKKK